MIRYIAVVLASLFIWGCNGTTGGVNDNLEAGTGSSNKIFANPIHANEQTVTQNPAHSSRFAKPSTSSNAKLAKPDTRSLDDITNAACTGADGKWHCNGQKKITLAASNPATYPPISWSTPNWYIDPANSTGCASDFNTCTSATCGSGPPGPGANVGPCKTITEITANRWGTSSPVLSQNVTIFVLSTEILGQENVVLTPILADGAVFGLIGTPKLVASFNLGAITAKNRSSHTLLQSTGFSASGLAVNQLIINTTHASHAWIYALTAPNATITQPLAPITIANASNFPSSMPAEVDNWTANDSVSVYTLPLVNIQLFAAQGGQTQASTIGGTTWMQYIRVPDFSGSPGNSSYNSSVSSVTIPWIVDSSIEPFAFIRGPDASGDVGTLAVNDLFLGGASISDGSVVGGLCELYGCSVYQFGVVDGDVIGTEAGNNAGINVYEQGFIGLAYSANGINLFNGARAKLDSIWYQSPPILWGTGTVNVADNSSLEKVDNNTWTTCLLLTTLQIDGLATGTKYIPGDGGTAGQWIDSVSVTAANLDSFGGLQNPKTGAKYCNTQ